MSTLILEVQFIDAMESVDKEFNTLTEVLFYLNGQRETDFDWLSLHDNNTDMVLEGWSDIHQYIHENAGMSKTACIALRATELNLPHVDVSGSDLPRVERFGDLPDGTLFYLAQTYAYGGRQKYQKAVEDGDNHNAVSVKDPSMTMRVPNMQLVFRA